jgi:hypothetical protein
MIEIYSYSIVLIKLHFLLLRSVNFDIGAKCFRVESIVW